VTVIGTPAVLPAVAEDFERLVMDGAAATVNGLVLELTLSEVTTLIVAAPAVVRLEPGMVAVQEVVLPQEDPVIRAACPPLNAQ
jgi:hypothetical protein